MGKKVSGVHLKWIWHQSELQPSSGPDIFSPPQLNFEFDILHSVIRKLRLLGRIIPRI
jgi:hypothetical protein